MRLRRTKFRSWLEAKSKDEIVGENRDCHSCPLALFYLEASGGCEVVIFQNEWGDYVMDRGYYKKRLPAWAAMFVFSVDGDTNGQLSAGRALEVLAQI